MCKTSTTCSITTVTEDPVTGQTKGCTSTPPEPHIVDRADGCDTGKNAGLIVSQPCVSIPSPTIENGVGNVGNNVENVRSSSLLVDNAGHDVNIGNESIECDNSISTNVVDNCVHAGDDVLGASMSNLPGAAECVDVDTASMYI
ncbi:hypothetical protein V6N13_088780 [Hibiscus sabdariffa]|uniref:Uncharacterized protein n=1 Tax=Hibiscus sabdariffa TaxID=183260 RepID=A0ABR2G0D7_9ROSI